MTLSHQDYFKIALPFIISTVTQPLLGAVDTAVIGSLGIVELIGGVAVGTVIMNTLYWLFGFFRVSTTGQSAIALGKNDKAEQAGSLIRPFLLAAMVGVIFILLKPMIWFGAMQIIEPDQLVAENAKIYFDILIFGAPFVLLNYTIIGWLMGQAKAKETLFTQVLGNVLNIVLDAVFVLGFGWGIEGVAYASLIAQIVTFALGFYFVLKVKQFSFMESLILIRMSKSDLKKIISSNTDLLLRTVCILIFFNIMARTGSQLGADTLATNAILMQITFIVSYMFDGIANASSVFAGKAVGEKDLNLLQQVFKLNFQWTTGFVVLQTLTLLCFNSNLVLFFTEIPEITTLYHQMSPWLIVFPFVAGYGLTLYGIFTGTGTTRPVRNSSILTLLIFLIAEPIFVAYWGNHGLWFAFSLFYCGRFLFLNPYLSRVKEKCVVEKEMLLVK